MSTNGQITFVTGSAAKRSYCHWDGYADGLGLDVLNWLAGILADGRENLEKQAAEKLTVVSDEPPFPKPTPEQKEALVQYSEANVGGPDEDWYRLTRKTQGNPAMILACGYSFDPDIGSEQDEHYNYVVDFAKRELRFHELSWSFDWLPLPDEFVKAVESS